MLHGGVAATVAGVALHCATKPPPLSRSKVARQCYDKLLHGTASGGFSWKFGEFRSKLLRSLPRKDSVWKFEISTPMQLLRGLGPLPETSARTPPPPQLPRSPSRRFSSREAACMEIVLVRKNPRVRKIFCPRFWGGRRLRQFYGHLQKMRSFCRKNPMPIKFLVWGGGIFGFWGRGEEVPIFFL